MKLSRLARRVQDRFKYNQHFEEEDSTYKNLGLAIMVFGVALTAYLAINSQMNVRSGPQYIVLNNHLYNVQQQRETAVIIYLRDVYKHRSKDRMPGPQFNQRIFKEMQLPGRLLQSNQRNYLLFSVKFADEDKFKEFLKKVVEIVYVHAVEIRSFQKFKGPSYYFSYGKKIVYLENLESPVDKKMIMDERIVYMQVPGVYIWKDDGIRCLNPFFYQNTCTVATQVVGCAR